MLEIRVIKMRGFVGTQLPRHLEAFGRESHLLKRV